MEPTEPVRVGPFAIEVTEWESSETLDGLKLRLSVARTAEGEASVRRRIATDPAGHVTRRTHRGRVFTPILQGVSVEEVVARLVSSRDVAEANPQADVRQLLLEGSFGLDPADEPLLEVPTPSGGRIDVQAGATVIEVKRRLAPSSLAAYEEQLGDYVRDRETETSQRWTAVLTDGREWRLYDVTPSGQTLVGRPFRAEASEPDALVHWLGTVLATRRNIPPVPHEIQSRLGVDSPSFALDLHALKQLYITNAEVPTVAVKRELWHRLLSDAFGTEFANDAEQADLFVRHTYLVVVAEVIAHLVVGFPVHGDASELLSGKAFSDAQVLGVVEEDFFDWIVEVPGGPQFVNRLVRRIAQFDFSHPSHDVLKTLYETVIDPDTRRRLGEYYTPDWLAEQMVESIVDDPLSQRVLDPACGSGTFLFWAIRRYLEAADAAGTDTAESLRNLPSMVSGLDLHPVAVTLARVTYLLAIGAGRLSERTHPLSIPVHLGDSMSWRQPDRIHTAGGIVISTAAGDSDLGTVPLWDEDIRLDDDLLQDPERFDLLIAELADRATSGRPLGNTLSRFAVPLRHQDQLESVYLRFRRLHDDGRDHVWGYFVRNLARPRSFLLNPVDRLIGNPPWLPYRNMTEPVKSRFKEGCQERGLWSGGRSATQQNLSAYFVVMAVSQFLRPDGKFGFVMPSAALHLRHYEGFRSGEWRGVNATFGTSWRLVHVTSTPPFFPVPCAVVFGQRTERPQAMGVDIEQWTGRLPAGTNHQWDQVSDCIKIEPGVVQRAAEPDHDYRDRFKNGATLYPRNLVVVTERDPGPLGAGPDRIAIQSYISPQAKEPWRSLEPLQGVLENQFIRPVYLGEHVLPFRTTTPLLAVVPWNGSRLINHDDPATPSGLADWWFRADELWRGNAGLNRSTETESLIGNIDYLGKLSSQFPTSPYRVVYTKAGNTLNAALVTDRRAVIDHKLYWAHAHSRGEASYLCGIFNSAAFRDEIEGFQSVGLFGPRDFDKYVFEVVWPEFSPDADLHREIVVAAQNAEEIASSLDLAEVASFTKARSMIRAALEEEGVSERLDLLVLDLLTQS